MSDQNGRLDLREHAQVIAWGRMTLDVFWPNIADPQIYYWKHVYSPFTYDLFIAFQMFLARFSTKSSHFVFF